VTPTETAVRTLNYRELMKQVEQVVVEILDGALAG